MSNYCQDFLIKTIIFILTDGQSCDIFISVWLRKTEKLFKLSSRNIFMTRISKNPEERKEEIMNASQRFFLEKGFQETKVDEIVGYLKIAKGTFYYYFKSKEEILDAIIGRYLDEVIEEIKIIIENKTIPVIKRLEMISLKELEINFKHLPSIHKIKNIDIHTRVNTGYVQKYAPILAGLIEEGVKEKIFYAENPLDIAQIFTITAHSVFDPGVFKWEKEEVVRKISIITRFMESALKAPEGSFDFMYSVFGKIYEIDLTGKSQ
jgi:AcrR family transcriptional regulator